MPLDVALSLAVAVVFALYTAVSMAVVYLLAFTITLSVS